MYVIYTQNMCGYCSLAKELLDERSIKYTEIPIPNKVSIVFGLDLIN